MGLQRQKLNTSNNPKNPKKTKLHFTVSYIFQALNIIINQISNPK